MITFAVETLAQCLPELRDLFPAHWKELALEQEKVPLDPQYEAYMERERRGEVLLVIGRSAGEIAAYFVGFVAPGLHYRTCLTLTMDIFWVHPKYRGHGAGFQLFAEMEREAKRRGVQRIFVGSKLHRDASFLFERTGYREVERYFSKWIGE